MRFPCWSLWLLLNETQFQFQFVYSQPIRIEAVRGQDPNLAFAERNPESKTLNPKTLNPIAVPVLVSMAAHDLVFD